MEIEKRIEIAEKIAALTGGKVWTKKGIVRVYISNGYAIVDTDGNVNVDGVNRNQFAVTKQTVENMGLKAYRA